jgi:hypothetical protein
MSRFIVEMKAHEADRFVAYGGDQDVFRPNRHEERTFPAGDRIRRCRFIPTGQLDSPKETSVRFGGWAYF